MLAAPHTAPPLGEATILFVRVEELDTLWASLGDALSASLGLYEEKVRVSLSRFGGYEIKREDTTYVYAFHDPAASLRAALALRTAIQAQEGRGRGELGEGLFHVGMGLHIGPLVVRPDPVTGRLDYLGTTMNLAARLAMATQGGQTLLTRNLLAAAEEHGFPVDNPGQEDAWIGYRGVHHFRGMNASAEILELRPRGQGSGVMRPLRTTQVVNQPPTTARLPALAAPLFGREEALTQAASALQAGERSLLLLGQAGVGKSRLAAELALWCEAGLGELRFPDGVWWVSAAGARTPEQLTAAVTRALGAPYLDQDPTGHLARLLATRSATLIILDEAEQARLVLGPWAARLRERAQELRLLVTSRSMPVALGGRVLRVGPLRAPRPGESDRALRRNPAVLLLLDRLRARFGKAVRKTDPRLLETLGALAARVDGLPFALQIMAERGEGEDLERWREAIHRWVTSATVELGPDPETAQAVRAVLTRGIQTLPAWTQAAFAQLCVFRGPLSAWDVDQIVSLEPWPEAPSSLAALGALLDHNLLARGLEHFGGQQTLCFRVPGHMLGLGMELLGQSRQLQRSDGSPWSGSAARATAERRHMEHFSALGEREVLDRLDGPEGGSTLELLMRSQENLVAATRRALRRGDGPSALRGSRALAALATRVGPAALLDRSLENAAALPDLPEIEVAGLHADLVDAHLAVGRSDEARDHLGEAIARVPRDGPPGLRGRLAALTLRVAAGRNGAQEVWARLDRALGLVRRAGDPRWIIWVLLERVRWALEDGVDLRGAELEEALLLARATKNRHMEVDALMLRADLSRAEARLDEAWAALRVAVLRGAALGPSRLALRARLALGDLAHALGMEEESRDALLEALPALVAMGDPVGLARTRDLTRLSTSDEAKDEDLLVRSIAPWIS